MKRNALLRHLRDHGCELIREGGNHSWWGNPQRNLRSSVPRHTEIKDIEQGRVIEDYPTDARGHSCLILGWGTSGRAIHVVCVPKDDYLAVITAYLPDETEWSHDFSMRMKR